MVFGAEAPNLATADKIAALLKAGKDNAAMKLAIGRTAGTARCPTASRSRLSSTSTLAWVIACFMDTQDGREHTLFGMEKVIHILP
jgi:hypothetical protein